MMNYEEIKAMIKGLASNGDAYARYNEDNICVTLIDCNEDWEECEYNNEDAVDAFMAALQDNCIKEEHDWGCECYTFEGFMVDIRYVSSEA